MNPIAQALGAGYSAKKILQYISKQNPKLAQQISSALNAGHTIDHVLNFLSKNEKKLGKLVSSDKEKNRSENLYKTAQRQIHPSLEGMAKFAGTAALGAAGGYALSRALPHIGGLAQTAMQQNIAPIQTAPKLTPSGFPISQTMPISEETNAPPVPQNNIPLSPKQPPVNADNIAQQAGLQQPEVKSIDVGELLNKRGLLKHVESMAKGGRDPKEIAAILYTKYPKEMKDFQKEAGKPMEDAIADFVGQQGQKQQIEPKIAQEIAQNEPKIEQIQAETEKIEPEIEKPIKKPKKIEKKSIVASPQGIGEVKEIRNGKALIDIDGKKHVVDEDELEPEPEEVKNAKLDFNLDEIPEDLRSAPLNEVYLPHDRRHVTVKYNAGLKPIRYLYFRKDGKSISTDYINKIVKGVQLPVTSGKSFWGVWNADKSDSRGAANYEELVKNSQEEGEPDDPSKEYWFIKEEALYEHPYLEKKGKEELRRMEKEFNEAKKSKKPKKKKS